MQPEQPALPPEEAQRVALSMIPINGDPKTWLPEHGWLLPEGVANVERGDDCSEDGEGFTLDPQEAVRAWWEFFAGKRAENERMRGTIQLMERSERKLSSENERLRAATTALVVTQPQWEPWKQQNSDWSEIATSLMIGQLCIAHARISVHQGSVSGTYSTATQRGTVYPAEHPSFVASRLYASLSAFGFPSLPPLPGLLKSTEPT